MQGGASPAGGMASPETLGAVFLGHRVVISTARPCRPKKIIDVDVPHPRDYGVVTSKRFREIMEETSDAVHEEALRAFQVGDKEG